MDNRTNKKEKLDNELNLDNQFFWVRIWITSDLGSNMNNQLLLWIIGRTKKRLIMGWIWRISDDQITLFDPSLIWLEHANRLEQEGFDLWHFEVHRRPAFMQEHLFVPHWPAQLQWTYPYPPLKDTSFDNARREMISMVFQPFKVSVNPIILGVHFLRQTSHWEWTVAGDHVCRQGDENSQMNSRRSQPQPRPQWPQFWLGQRPRD